MTQPVAEPEGREVMKAGLVAALAAVAVVMLAMLATTPREVAAGLVVLGFLFGMPIALLHAFALGLPAYLILRGRWGLHWWNAALAGLLVGALPSLLLDVVTLAEAMASEQGRFAQRILSGMLESAAVRGLAGVAGGLAFRFMLQRQGSCR